MFILIYTVTCTENLSSRPTCLTGEFCNRNLICILGANDIGRCFIGLLCEGHNEVSNGGILYNQSYIADIRFLSHIYQFGLLIKTLRDGSFIAVYFCCIYDVATCFERKRHGWLAVGVFLGVSTKTSAVFVRIAVGIDTNLYSLFLSFTFMLEPRVEKVEAIQAVRR
jgi:hypothetical protein